MISQAVTVLEQQHFFAGKIVRCQSRLARKRVRVGLFKIDLETGDHLGGAVRVIARIEDPAVLKQMLDHLERRDPAPTSPQAEPGAGANLARPNKSITQRKRPLQNQ